MNEISESEHLVNLQDHAGIWIGTPTKSVETFLCILCEIKFDFLFKLLTLSVWICLIFAL